MTGWHRISLRLCALFRKQELDAELDEELRFHVERQMEANIQAGMKPEEARYAALRNFGWVESIKEKCRDQRRVGWLEDALSDLRFGMRILAKQPEFTVVSLLSLAVAIGATTAMFGMVDRLLLRPIPGQHAERLLRIREVKVAENQRMGVSPAVFSELAAFTNLFTAVAAWKGTELVDASDRTPITLPGVAVTADFFDILGARPQLGRGFLPDEGAPGKDDVLVISYGLWQKRFAKDPAIVGKSVVLSGKTYAVVGVMPASFQFPYQQSHFWRPQLFGKQDLEDRVLRYWDMLAVLQPQANRDHTLAALNVVSARLQRDFPQLHRGWNLQTESLRSLFVNATTETTLWSLTAAIVLLLFTCCANVGTLLFAGLAKRRREFAIRIAIGGGRLRIVRQLLVESVMLSVVGGLLGVLFAWAGTHLISAFVLGPVPVMRGIGLDWPMMGFTGLVSLLTGIAFGVLPAWSATGGRVSNAMREGEQHSSSALQRLLHEGLIVAEFSMAVTLLLGSVLMIRSVTKLLRVHPGLDPKGLVEVWFKPLRAPGGISVQSTIAWNETMLERLGSLPGIRSVGFGTSEGRGGQEFSVEGYSEPAPLDRCFISVGTNAYFDTLGSRLLAGRPLTQLDAMAGQTAVMINRAFADKYWPGGNALGKHLSSRDQGNSSIWEVVGVVENIMQWRLDKPSAPAFYEPFPRVTNFVYGAPFMLRTSLDMTALTKSLKQVGTEMSPSSTPFSIQAVEATLYRTTAPRRLLMWFLNVFGLITVAVSAIGLYGMLALAVTQRTKEIGIRMALGATKPVILQLVLGRSMRLILNGAILGMVAGFTLSKLMEALLYQVQCTDPFVLAGVLVVLGCTVTVASYIPARRATQMDPVRALRYE